MTKNQKWLSKKDNFNYDHTSYLVHKAATGAALTCANPLLTALPLALINDFANIFMIY